MQGADKNNKKILFHKNVVNIVLYYTKKSF